MNEQQALFLELGAAVADRIILGHRLNAAQAEIKRLQDELAAVRNAQGEPSAMAPQA